MKMKIENGLVIRTVPQVAIRGRGGMVGCKTVPFPSFQRRGGCATNKKTPFLSGADGVVSDFQQKIRIAARHKEATRPFTNYPGAARHPLLENGGEWGRLGTNPLPSFQTEANGFVIDFEIPSLRQSVETRC